MRILVVDDEFVSRTKLSDLQRAATDLENGAGKLAAVID